jgi:hypothetical protein
MGGTTAKLVDAPTFDGRGIAATLPRSEVEQAVARKGDVSLKLEVEARPDGAADFEAHTLEIGWDRADLERLLEESSGDEVTLTFDARELAEVIDPDVEGQLLRERVAVLTVAVAAATAGTAGYVATTMAHHESKPTSYAYVHSTAPIDQVSDAASGGGYGAATVQPTSVEQVSDAASGGGYPTASIEDAATAGGYTAGGIQPTSVEQATDAATAGGYTAGGVQPTSVEQVSDAASGGGYTAAAPTEDAATAGGYTAGGMQPSQSVQGAEQYAGYQHPTAAPVEQVADAATAGGYTAGGIQPTSIEQVSDAATGGYTQAAPADQGDVVSRAAANQEAAQGDVLSRAVANDQAGTVQGAGQYAGYQHPTAPTPELTSDAASGGGYQADTAAGAASASKTADVHNIVTDAGSGGPELMSDAATGGYTAPTATPAATGGGGTFDTPATPGLIAGGIALLITGAAFATGKARVRRTHPA